MTACADTDTGRYVRPEAGEILQEVVQVCDVKLTGLANSSKLTTRKNGVDCLLAASLQLVSLAFFWRDPSGSVESDMVEDNI